MLNKILAPLDGSKLGECTMDYVKAIAANRSGAEVVLLTIIESTIPSWTPTTRSRAKAFSEQWHQMQKQMNSEAGEYLTKAEDVLKKDGIAVKTEIIEAGSGEAAADIIVDYAEKNKMELIVMSTHGRSGISRWVMGSTADRVVNHARVPVLTVAPAGCRL
jgi:nucleotide-binding universal stress UspA family protein